MELGNCSCIALHPCSRRMTLTELIYTSFLNYIHALEYPFNPCHPCSISFFAE